VWQGTRVPDLCQISHESVQRCGAVRGENADFWHVSKVNTDSLPLRGILPVKKQNNKHHIFAPTAGARYTMFPKLCMVIEHVDTIKRDGNHFLK